MGTQDQLFHEDFRDALKHLVKALGGFEAVGLELWPAKSMKAAGNWLRDCLDPERPAKLDLEEVVRLLRMGRERGVHCAVHKLADETGYERPGIAPCKTKAQLIGEQMAHHLREFQRLANEQAAALTANELRAVK
ncbi:MAG TPA: hypothetical protein VF193_01295 [Steroidobacter sp.]